MGFSSVDVNNVQGATLPALTNFTVADFARLAWPQETSNRAGAGKRPLVIGPEAKVETPRVTETISRKAPEKSDIEKRRLQASGYEQFGHWHTPLYGAVGIRPRW